MKKSKILLAAVLCVVGLAGITSCKKEEEDKTITIQFVPSQDASVISAQTATIKSLLEKEMPGYTFDISTGTSYTAVLEGMDAGQVDVGFLTSQQYAYAQVEMPGAVEVILTSVRSAYQVQIDYPNDFDKQIKAMNGTIDNYDYKGQQATEQVTYYNSICITKNDSTIATVGDLAGKKVGVQKSTSGAGYVYPSVLLSKTKATGTDNYMKFVKTETADASKGEVKAVEISGYPAAVTAVLNGDVDAAWIFLDARYSAFYADSTAATYDANIFAKTKCVGMTTGIYNDTISVAKHVSATTKTKIQNAFQNIIKTTEGKEALYKVYSHTGYKVTTAADYAGEVEVYKWKKDNLG